jgi:hypothetical protein
MNCITHSHNGHYLFLAVNHSAIFGLDTVRAGEYKQLVPSYAPTWVARRKRSHFAEFACDQARVYV